MKQFKKVKAPDKIFVVKIIGGSPSFHVYTVNKVTNCFIKKYIYITEQGGPYKIREWLNKLKIPWKYFKKDSYCIRTNTFIYIFSTSLEGLIEILSCINVNISNVLDNIYKYQENSKLLSRKFSSLIEDLCDLEVQVIMDR